MSNPQCPSTESKTLVQANVEANSPYQGRRYAEAEPIVYEAWQRDRRNPELPNLRGVTFAGMEPYWNAVWYYRDALALNPSGSGIWTNLGNTLACLKHLESAVHRHECALLRREAKCVALP